MQRLTLTSNRLFALAIALTACVTAVAAPYVPPAGETWASKPPTELGLRNECVQGAIAFAKANEANWLTDVRAQIEKDTAHEPYPEVLGPTTARGAQNGMIVRRGYIAAEWGDTRKVDMTFSVAKSYLATLAGLAIDRGLIKDVHEAVAISVRDGGFASERNAKVTWHMLLNQTSEWEGTLWDKPDSADRRRGHTRTLQAPGEFWEYNDVRVNRLALSLLQVFRKPLPEVLREAVMTPIGASDTWQWHGYFNSYIELDGRRVQSVSGGSHWGGGLWASTRDHARFGLLFARNGDWNGKQVISRDWIEAMRKPTALAPYYGYLWWLPHSSSPVFRTGKPSSFFALGSGGNMIWVDPQYDLVVVTRWLEPSKLNEFVQRVSGCIEE